MIVKFQVRPDRRVLIYQGAPGVTYEEALLSLGINPDTVLILVGGISLPQDEKITVNEVDIIETCSMG
ncbi:MAG: thiamine S protein [Methanomicrobiales archaeon]|jgi:sulfur carrier protein ThiS|nr:thiamine S protein [Methanomicrobiales archaeon]